ncbi:MAG TPA: cytochrome P450 [Stellaceae bacterium]|nr:cytochrome P450 [Stellaceae bacterium]
MSGFVPPYPPRPAQPLSPLAVLAAARRNLLSVWEEAAYEQQFFSARILSRRIFVCNSPDTVAQAFIALHDSFQRKTPQMRHALDPLLGDGLFISDGPVWKQRRAIVAPIVHASRIDQFAPVMVEAAAETAARWRALPPGSEIDALREMGALTAEIICRAIFGPRLGHEHAHEIVASFAEYQAQIGQLDLVYMLGLPDWLPRWYPGSVRRAAGRIHAILDRIIAEARAEDSMIRLLLQARDPETGAALDPGALRNEAAVIFMAGHETTANTLAWCWFLLSQAEDAETRHHAELDAVLGGRPPNLADLPRLVFTRAVVEETLRLYPPVPILGRQALRGEKIRNREIPAGSLLLVIPWLLHRHRRLWEQPDHYLPERFLPENAEARQRYSYIPFAVGPRVCAGQAFGLTEAILCVATLAQAVRLRLKSGEQVEPVCRLTLRPGNRLPMSIESRG